MLSGLAADRVVFIDYRDHPNEYDRVRAVEFRDYTARLYTDGRCIHRHAHGAALSEVWNLAGVLADFHAAATGEPGRPWHLVVIDPAALVYPDGLTALTLALENGADVAYLGTDHFDGLAFAIASTAGTGILLTSHEHLDRRTCALDFVATLDPEADIVGVPYAL